jgi:hypothetical protein
MPEQARWAKAPEATRALREATSAETREFLEAGLRPVACHRCGTGVLVRKSSPGQTSIQWTGDPAASCPVFAASPRRSGGTPALDGCDELAASIAREVARGRIEVESSGGTEGSR